MSSKEPLNPDLVKEFVMASHGNFEKVEALLKEQPNLIRASWDWGGGEWESGLEAAGHVGNREVAEYLLSNGATQTVFCAAMLGDVELVKSFIASDPAVINIPGVHRISLMYHVALSGKVELAEALEKAGSPADKNRALQAATQLGHTSMVGWLVENGVTDINTLNFEEKTPLAIAVEKAYTEIADLLRSNGGRE